MPLSRRAQWTISKPFWAAFLVFFGLVSLANQSTVIAQGMEPRVLLNIAYGRDRANRFDVYLPKAPRNAPTIFMVHGGGWIGGDKASDAVVRNKINRWVKRGFIFITTNYRVRPKASPVQQSHDVARALAKAQRLVPTWGGNPNHFVLMGHSSGAHLVALITADPRFSMQRGAQKWLASVLIDTAALDVPAIMTSPHLPLYDRAFGAEKHYWYAASPYHRLTTKVPPMLSICSTLRVRSCRQSKRFAAKARKLGTDVTILEIPLNHRKLNRLLGQGREYTRKVEAFLVKAAPVLAARLEGERAEN